MASTTGIRLRDIREHEGTQARAWEELVYQLRPAVHGGHIQTRKTRAPDGGVEWYEIYADGHHEGFQAKFNESLEDALGGMLESVKAVASKRPDMTRLTFIVPYDFTDAASKRSKSDQTRWDDAVKRWQKDVTGADRLSFDIIRAGDIVAELSRAAHAGRRAYWFRELELSEAWFKQRLSEATSVAGDRYTPEADTPSRVQSLLDAVSATSTFLSHTRGLVDRVISTCRRDRGVWGGGRQTISEQLSILEALRDQLVVASHEGSTIPSGSMDFEAITAAVNAIHDVALNRSRDAHSREERALDDVVAATSALIRFGTGTPGQLYRAKAVAVEGPAGQGKTHALMKQVDALLGAGVPAIALLGQRLRSGNWWSSVASALGGLTQSSDEFLDALDSLAEARGCRALIVIDALNEAEDPRMWRSELPALLSQVDARRHVSLVVSYRSDYRHTVSPPEALPVVRHPGFAGHEMDALSAYSKLFKITLSPHTSLGPSFSNPLFLRMYCAVLAGDTKVSPTSLTRSSLFSHFADLQSRRVRETLHLPPTSTTVTQAIAIAADLLVENEGHAVPRAKLEARIDTLLPGRPWPSTLFQQLVSEGLLEIRPDYDGNESVSFPFQAYSEHLLAKRLLDHDTARLGNLYKILKPQDKTVTRKLRKRLGKESWLWRSMSVILPETHGVELIDLLPKRRSDDLMIQATMESFTDRAAEAFSQRTMRILEGELRLSPEDWVNTVLALAPQKEHPANADWLHARLVTMALPERDATWSIDNFQVDDNSSAFARISRWADRGGPLAELEQARLVCTTLIWLLTSPNRFLRDRCSRSLVALLAQHLDLGAYFIGTARGINDPYVQERALTCLYGAVMIGGSDNTEAVRQIVNSIDEWSQIGLPIHAVARDSARGLISWARHYGLAEDYLLLRVSPPYGAEPPSEPPTADALKSAHGTVKNQAGDYVEWRAYSILSSCLDWMGDFNKYVVQSDVGFFSRYALSGPPPVDKYSDPKGEVDADWAGRWIAHRAIELGWTAQRFEAFERNHDLRKGRDGHKAERFGKKYQWIALQELLARLADNFHPAAESWHSSPASYEGPWAWYGRDFDPSLPPSDEVEGKRICKIGSSSRGRWAEITPPEMDSSDDPDHWVARQDDLPSASSMFFPLEDGGKQWVALHRYASWDRDNSTRSGLYKRERDVFFLQFAWLTPAGDGKPLHDLLLERGLSGRWMPDATQPYTQYLGEEGWAPIAQSTSAQRDDEDQPIPLRELGLSCRPAVEQYLWEGNILDCSIDENVDIYVPSNELLGHARRVGFTSEWRVDTGVVVKAVRIHDGSDSQFVLLADRQWIESRLRDLGVDLVIATLSEKHALRDEDDDHNMAFSDIWYSARMSSDAPSEVAGPYIEVRAHGE
ncbi:UNVERIFIED_ORG: hypothetical protein J3D58_000676 [Paenarthrobacter nicotinovorans]